MDLFSLEFKREVLKSSLLWVNLLQQVQHLLLVTTSMIFGLAQHQENTQVWESSATETHTESQKALCTHSLVKLLTVANGKSSMVFPSTSSQEQEWIRQVKSSLKNAKWPLDSDYGDQMFYQLTSPPYYLNLIFNILRLMLNTNFTISQLSSWTSIFVSSSALGDCFIIELYLGFSSSASSSS